MWDAEDRYYRTRRAPETLLLCSEQVREELRLSSLMNLASIIPNGWTERPGSATTLNEALIIMLMTDWEHRKNILDRAPAMRKRPILKNLRGNTVTWLASMLRDVPACSGTEKQNYASTTKTDLCDPQSST